MRIDSFQFGLSHSSDLKNVFNKLYSQIYDHQIFPFLSRTKTRYFAELEFRDALSAMSKAISEGCSHRKKKKVKQKRIPSMLDVPLHILFFPKIS